MDMEAAYNDPDGAVEYLNSDVLSTAGGGKGIRRRDLIGYDSEFQGLRAIVQGHPDFLELALKQLKTQNPDSWRTVQQYPELLDLLNEPLKEESGRIFFNMQSADEYLSVECTPIEQEAVKRLEQKGYKRDYVIEAFRACNEDEESAAHYLLEHLESETTDQK